MKFWLSAHLEFCGNAFCTFFMHLESMRMLRLFCIKLLKSLFITFIVMESMREKELAFRFLPAPHRPYSWYNFAEFFLHILISFSEGTKDLNKWGQLIIKRPFKLLYQNVKESNWDTHYCIFSIFCCLWFILHHC